MVTVLLMQVELQATANLRTSFLFVHKLLICISDFLFKADSLVSDGTMESSTATMAQMKTLEK